MRISVVAVACLAIGGALAINAPAYAKTRAECVKEWQDKKAADSAFKTLQKDFLPGCMKPAAPAAVPAKPAAPAAAATPAPAQAAKTTPAATAKPADGRLAEVARIKACGAEWKADKAAGKTGGLTWPKYWSECNKRKKAAGM